MSQFSPQPVGPVALPHTLASRSASAPHSTSQSTSTSASARQSIARIALAKKSARQMGLRFRARHREQAEASPSGPLHSSPFMASLLLAKPPFRRVGGTGAVGADEVVPPIRELYPSKATHVRAVELPRVPRRPHRSQPVSPRAPSQWTGVLGPASGETPSPPLTARITARSNFYGRSVCLPDARRHKLDASKVVRGMGTNADADTDTDAEPEPGVRQSSTASPMVAGVTDRFDPELTMFGPVDVNQPSPCLPLSSPVSTPPGPRRPRASPLLARVSTPASHTRSRPTTGSPSRESHSPQPPPVPMSPEALTRPRSLSPQSPSLRPVHTPLTRPPLSPLSSMSSHSSCLSCDDDDCGCRCSCPTDATRFYASDSSDGEVEFDARNKPVNYETPLDIIADRNCSRYWTTCDTQSVVPEASAMALDPAFSSAVSVNLSASGIGSRFLQPLASSMPGLTSLRTLNLARNRLDGRCTVALVASLPPQLTALNLAHNVIGATGAKSIAQAINDGRLRLTALDVSGCKLGTRAASAIVTVNIRTDSLVSLDLSDNNLTAEFGPLCARLMVACCRLTQLSLSWNSLRPALDRIAKGWELSPSLQTLDLSWNEFGRGAAEPAIDALIAALEHNTTMTHLDLSHNGFDGAVCQRVATVLEPNHRLLGVHLDCGVDARGFVHPGTSGDKTQGHCPTHVLGRAAAGAGTRAGTGVLNDCRQNCWLCEEWVEVEFRYSPVQSGPMGSRVTVHCSFDNWVAEELKQIEPPPEPKQAEGGPAEPDTAKRGSPRPPPAHPPAPHLQPHSASASDDAANSSAKSVLNRLRRVALADTAESANASTSSLGTGSPPAPPPFTVTRIIPPGVHQYIFCVDGTPFFAVDQPHVVSGRRVKLWLGIKDTRGSGDLPPTRPSSPALAAAPSDGTPPTDSTTAGSATVPPPPVTASKPAEMTFSLPPKTIVNTLDTTGMAPPTPSTRTILPRTLHAKLVEPSNLERRHVTSFNLKLSVFAAASHSSPDKERESFDIDISRTKLDRFIKNPDMLWRVRAVLFTHVKALRSIFRFYSVASSASLTSMGWNEFTSLMNACAVPDGGTCSLRDLDTIFIVSNVPRDRNPPGLSARRLGRFQFYEALVRVAVAKYLSSNRVADECDAVEELLEDCMLPLAERVNVELWRSRRLYRINVDSLLKSKLPMLKAVFRARSSRATAGLGPRRMTVYEFESLMADARVVETNKDARYAFARSLGFRVDEWKTGSTGELLSFVEFLEAVCHVAEMHDSLSVERTRSALNSTHAVKLTLAAIKAKDRLKQFRDKRRRASLSSVNTINTVFAAGAARRFSRLLLGGRKGPGLGGDGVTTTPTAPPELLEDVKASNRLKVGGSDRGLTGKRGGGGGGGGGGGKAGTNTDVSMGLGLPGLGGMRDRRRRAASVDEGTSMLLMQRAAIQFQQANAARQAEKGLSPRPPPPPRTLGKKGSGRKREGTPEEPSGDGSEGEGEGGGEGSDVDDVDETAPPEYWSKETLPLAVKLLPVLQALQALVPNKI